jgi:hypothetical protein
MTFSRFLQMHCYFSGPGICSAEEEIPREDFIDVFPRTLVDAKERGRS